MTSEADDFPGEFPIVGSNDARENGDATRTQPHIVANFWPAEYGSIAPLMIRRDTRPRTGKFVELHYQRLPFCLRDGWLD